VKVERLKGRRLAWSQFRAVVRKEALQTFRDRRIISMLVLAPLIQVVLFGLAVDFDVDHVPTAVVDMDGSATSRAQLRQLLADGTLRRVARVSTEAEANQLLDQGVAGAAVIIPAGFGADLEAGRSPAVQVLVDGADPLRSSTVVSTTSQFFGRLAAQGLRERLAEAGRTHLPEVKLVPRVFFNPRLKTAVYMVPGILAMLLVSVTTIVTAMGLSREREMGTLEQLLVTPVEPLTLLGGKMVPFVAVGFFDVLLLLAIMTGLFEVPIRGPLPVLALGTLLYVCSTLGVGLLVSTVSSDQQQGFMGGFLFMLPAALLSGIMTPVSSMPAWLQPVTWLNPLRFFAELVRGVLLRGAGFRQVWPQLLILTVFGVTLMSVATYRFRRKLA
jgi:ABC-2 type transport system permease protein